MSKSNRKASETWRKKETLADHLEPLLKRYDVKYRGHGIIYVDHELYNIVTTQKILTDLSTSLGVPKESIRSRLVELGWLIDVRGTAFSQANTTHMISALKNWKNIEPAEYNTEPDEQFDQDIN